MIWYPVIRNLADFLSAYRLPDGTNPFAAFDGGIYPGTKGNARNKSCIEVLWNTESGQSLHTRTNGEISAFIDVVVRTDKTNEFDAYNMAYDAHVNIVSALLVGGWAINIRKLLGIALNTNLKGIMSDGEIMRPTFTTRMVFDIEWKKARETL